ncbi:MAG: MBOAT family protein [Lachnospiraceae bacterium]|nr:MBOAT family protein [Lachnospiraceae bacterium]
MLFNSYIFIFIFLPITLLGWYGLNIHKKYTSANIYLAGMSLWFYGYFNVYYLAIILSSIGFNYLLSYLLTKIPAGNSAPITAVSDSSDSGDTALSGHAGLWRRVGLIAGILINLGILFYFKYYDFFIENINLAFHTDYTLRHILLPLGISFFTFQQLSFIIDRCTGKCEHYSLINYVTFVTFFPQLIAGPIVQYKEMIPQFEDTSRRSFNAASFSRGIYLFVLGLAKKVLLADTFALMANYGFAQTFSLDCISTIAVILAYTFELYFDFSGYSDMAIGLGRMFNIELPVNFNAPYRACSIKEFWQRWHITLSRFFVTYVYIPLGGSRKGRVRMLINTFIIFLLSGLWHGAAWTYVAWGAMHGLLVVWDNLGIIGIKGRDEKRPSCFHIPAWLGWIFTFTLFNLSLFFFRSTSMTAALQLFKNLFIGYTGKIYDVAAQLNISEMYAVRQVLELVAPGLMTHMYLVLMIILFVLAFYLIFRPNAYERAMRGELTSARCWGICILLVWCVVSLSQVSTFLYFNF